MAVVRLKELVQVIRHQLEDLDNERAASGKDSLFELEGMELELKFTVEESSAASGGFDLKVVALGGEKQDRLETIQTIKINYRVSDSYQGFGRRAHSSVRKPRGKSHGVKPLE